MNETMQMDRRYHNPLMDFSTVTTFHLLDSDGNTRVLRGKVVHPNDGVPNDIGMGEVSWILGLADGRPAYLVDSDDQARLHIFDSPDYLRRWLLQELQEARTALQP